ncbi:DNA alkylation repair enzyme [Stackebrandtia albiflava]|uniref:DNA alkylation repair enzyme n=1 Tax=Stackebrandtia albiflava TaxID=406432 RepID=A0A562UYU4_9ACTN|nr:DNA alkylation repair protein [Stackebrandtia albiflava]TWJ10782.1 DNA alkylation repair enzyme [Stackebrandtia albiflava]
METTADAFITELATHERRDGGAERPRHFHGGEDTLFMGLRMRDVFDTAKRHVAMPPAEVERLLESRYYEARVGAVAVLDFKVRRRRVTDEERRLCYELYLRRHDRIDNWDLVDRAAPRVVGGYLLDKPRDPLFRLAESTDRWERRTAITAAFWIIRQGDLDDPLALAERLRDDPEELVNKSVGVALREIGRVDESRLRDFLDRFPGLPRVTLRYAVERLTPELRRHYLSRR